MILPVTKSSIMVGVPKESPLLLPYLSTVISSGERIPLHFSAVSSASTCFSHTPYSRFPCLSNTSVPDTHPSHMNFPDDKGNWGLST